MLGTPHLHLRGTGSTNDVARGLAEQGAPHGTLVTASAQSAGRGRQGRTWSAPPGAALLCSVVLRSPELPGLLPLAAAVAVAETCGEGATIKWPNDVWLAEGRKVAGILAEGRPQEGWAVLGIGVNVAVDPAELPEELRRTAASLGRPAAEVPVFREALMARLDDVLALDPGALLHRWRARDALHGREVGWHAGAGRAAGIDDAGRLLVELDGGGRTALDAGEVHLRLG